MLQQVSGLYREIKDLLEAPDLLDHVQRTFAAMGYVGDPAPPTLMYLAMTSRLLPRPMNAACVGPSSVGKNETVNAAKALIPAEDVYEVNAGSPLALVYNDASFERKVVIYSELDSIPEDGPAGSAVRSLATTSELAYDVVEKDHKTGRYQTRHIRKAGPTVLITTGVRSPGQQLGTRMLELSISDAPQQTWAILERQALEASGRAPTPPDLRPWADLQRWLALQPTRVRLPFAAELLAALKARLKTPPVRLRRDFMQLQTCTMAIALLHQCQRERARDGAVLATLADYEAARVLLEPIFGAISTEGVTKVVRETVAKVADGEEVSEAELVGRLGLSKMAVYERVKKALAGGWLVNLEERRGHAAKLVRGTPLPEDRRILPTQADLLPDPSGDDIGDDAEDGIGDPPRPGGSAEPPGNGQGIAHPEASSGQAHSGASPGEHPPDRGLTDARVTENAHRPAVLVDQEADSPSPPSPADSSVALI
jgi:hypothetical protein